MRSRWARLTISAILLFGIAFGIYVKTLAPTITWRHNGADGGDLVAAIGTLGIPHPPGYPTYVLLGRLFSIIPLGDLAYRINLMSAFSAASAVVLTFFATMLLLALHENRRVVADVPSLLSAGAGALSLAFAPIFWSQAVIAEAYALNAFFVSLLLFLLVSWVRAGESVGGIGRSGLWWLAGASLALGLGAGNHLTILLIAPASLFLLGGSRRVSWRVAGLIALLFILGSMIYLYLPLRAARNPPINWGDPTSLRQFLWTATGEPYRQYVLGLPLQFLAGRVAAWGKLLLEQFNALGLMIGILGWLNLWGSHKRLSLFLLSFFLLVSIYSITYNTTDSSVYLIPSLAVFSICIGMGLHFLLTNLVAPWLSRMDSTRQQRFNLTLIAGLLFLLLPGFSLYRNYPQIDLSQDRSAYSYAESALSEAEPGSVILADTDPYIFSLWYFRYVVQPRSDVAVVAKPLLQYDWYREGLKRRMPQIVPEELPEEYSRAVLEIVNYNLGKRAVYLTAKDDSLLGSYTQQKDGPLFRLEAGQKEPPR